VKTHADGHKSSRTIHAGVFVLSEKINKQSILILPKPLVKQRLRRFAEIFDIAGVIVEKPFRFTGELRAAAVFSAGGAYEQLKTERSFRFLYDAPRFGIRHIHGGGRSAKRVQAAHAQQQLRNAGAEAFFLRVQPHRNHGPHVRRVFHSPIVSYVYPG
jgi:hypothetical protein